MQIKQINFNSDTDSEHGEVLFLENLNWINLLYSKKYTTEPNIQSVNLAFIDSDRSSRFYPSVDARLASLPEYPWMCA